MRRFLIGDTAYTLAKVAEIPPADGWPARRSEDRHIRRYLRFYLPREVLWVLYTLSI